MDAKGLPGLGSPDPVRSPAIWILGLGIVLALLLLGLASQESASLDGRLHRYFAETRTESGVSVATWVTHLGSFYWSLIVCAAAIIAGWLRRKTLGNAVFLLATAGLALISTQVIKRLVERPRPSQGTAVFEGYAFPSGHSSNAFALYGGLALLMVWAFPFAPLWLRTLTHVCALALAATIAFTRVYLGAHWPSDVLAGALLGIFWVAVFSHILRTHSSQWAWIGMRQGPQ